MLKSIKRLAIGTAAAAAWPAYLGIASAVVRSGPWPRSLSRPLSFAMAVLAGVAFAAVGLRLLVRKDGLLQATFDLPNDVLRQVRRSGFTLLIGAAAFALPEELLSRGLITSNGRSVAVPTLCHLLVITFELLVWIGVGRLLRSRGPLGSWLQQSPDALGWLGRRRRWIRMSLLVGLGAIISLEIRGYGFTARRISLAFVQTIVIGGMCWGLHRIAIALIAKHGHRWVRREAKIAAKGNASSIAPPADLPARVRHLCDWAFPIAGGLIGLYVWDVDLALFNYVGEQNLWKVGEGTYVTVANLGTACVLFTLTAGAWRYLSTIFALVIYPRMTEDPGIRFAVVTLARYLVLALGLLSGLSALHLGLDKIGVVLAALGVGLGFGLQEIVSNFVSGIILLLERPIRVGDIVTVAAMTGKIDRINIRATTLINADNQSLIIPNREFITGNLINWTHKDKVIRFSIHVSVALGTDPDRVSELLLAIARADSDVLGNPVPQAFLDAFGPSSLSFLLHVHVPDPTFPGKVRHRLCSQIQKRFAAEGIQIALPVQELRVDTIALDGMLRGTLPTSYRIDEPSPTPPPTVGLDPSPPVYRPRSQILPAHD